MTEKSSKDGISRRDFVAATGAAAVGGAVAAAGTAASAAPSNEICRMDAVTLAEKIRTKQLSATEVTEAVLGRMDKLNPVLGAFCTPSPDVARAQAKAIDADIMAGKTVGPLAGVPVGIKDLVYTKGIRTTSGSIIYKDYVPTEDDVVVERLKAAGVIIIGKTNVPELGYSGASYNLIFPPTNNPWNTERTAGGSSAGSGAAVAAGIGPMAIGSDGGGSVASLALINGLFGLKGSMGRVPLYPGTKDETAPGVSGWKFIQHIGPITRTVADGALMMSVIASGPDDRDRRTIPNDINWMGAIKGDIKGLRVAWTPDLGVCTGRPRGPRGLREGRQSVCRPAGMQTRRGIALEGRLFRTLLHHRAHRNRSQRDARAGGEVRRPHAAAFGRRDQGDDD